MSPAHREKHTTETGVVEALVIHRVRHELQVLSAAALQVRGAVADPHLRVTPFRLAVQVESLLLPLRRIQESLIDGQGKLDVIRLGALLAPVLQSYGEGQGWASVAAADEGTEEILRILRKAGVHVL